VPTLISFPGIALAVPGLVHGVTERTGGVSRDAYAALNLGRSCGDDPDAVTENGRLLRERLSATEPVRFPHQVHGCHVALVDDQVDGPVGPADAVITAVPGRAVGVLGADCPGVLVVDPLRRVVAVVHSGWRGTVAGVLPAVLETLRHRYASTARDLLVGIGPGISAACYEVGPDVVEPFLAAFPAWGPSCLVRGRGDRSHLDLAEALRRQALDAGVRDGSIERSALCTFRERERLFSHRRDGPRTGRHALVAMWRSATDAPEGS